MEQIERRQANALRDLIDQQLLLQKAAELGISADADLVKRLDELRKQMKAGSIEEPSRLVQSLTGAILGCGGWVLSRGASDTGTVNMLFEFERQACVEIYSVMIAAGLELSQSGHIRFTELCQCTRSHQQDCGTEIASVDLEVQTFPVELMQAARATETA